MLVSSIERHEQGMGMVLRKEAIQALIGYKSMGPRMIKARFHTQSGKATIVQVLCTNNQWTEQEKMHSMKNYSKQYKKYLIKI